MPPSKITIQKKLGQWIRDSKLAKCLKPSGNFCSTKIYICRQWICDTYCSDNDELRLTHVGNILQQSPLQSTCLLTHWSNPCCIAFDGLPDHQECVPEYIRSSWTCMSVCMPARLSLHFVRQPWLKKNENKGSHQDRLLSMVLRTAHAFTFVQPKSSSAAVDRNHHLCSLGFGF